MFSIINTGLTSSQRDLSVTANNLANSNTVGFKKSKSNFVDIFANDPAGNSKTAVGSGTMMATVDKDMSQGSMTSTGRVTDLAIAGKGMFVLESPKETKTTTTQLSKSLFSQSVNQTSMFMALQSSTPNYYYIGGRVDLSTASNITLFRDSQSTGLTALNPTGGSNGGFTDGYTWYDDNNKPINTGNNQFFNYLGFGFDATASNNRSVESEEEDIFALDANKVTLLLIAGNGTNGGTKPSSPAGDLKVAYSLDGGTTYTQIATFDGSGTNFDTWKEVEITLPNEAITNHTKFKFYQDGTTSPTGDNWGLYAYDFAGSLSGLPVTEPPSSNVANSTSIWTNGGLTGSLSNTLFKTEGTGTSNAGGFSGRNDYVSFGGGGTIGKRYFQIASLDLRDMNSLSFDVMKGNGTNGGDAPEANEGFNVEYSVDGGQTFTSLTSLAYNATGLNSWANQSVTLPPAAKVNNAIVRFAQPQSSGSGYDNWGLSNIQITGQKTETVTTGGALTYTRAGNFALDKDGYVVNSVGSRLVGTNLKTDQSEGIQIATTKNGVPLESLTIDPKGMVNVSYAGQAAEALYQITLANFANDAGLKPIGNTSFIATGDSGNAKLVGAGSAGTGTIMAATLEQSNVDITGELMMMLRSQQGYNANARMLQAYVEVASRLTDKI